MNTNYTYSSTSIKQHINKDVAVCLIQHANCDIDELLVTAATPAILADFKHIELKSMYRVMIKMKLFLKGKQRFQVHSGTDPFVHTDNDIIFYSIL